MLGFILELSLYLLCISLAIILLACVLQGDSIFLQIVTWFFPQVLWEVRLRDRKRKVVALTIDDAPRDGLEEILPVLAKHDVKATFFTISGQIPGREHLLRRAVEEGHELQNHGNQDELHLKEFLTDPKGFEKSLLECENAILEYRRYAKNSDSGQHGRSPNKSGSRVGEVSQQGGHHVSETYKCYRPGGGLFSFSMIRAIKATLGSDRRVVLGTVYPMDAGAVTCPHRLKVWWVPKRVHPGAIMILHDRGYSPPVLDEILTKIKTEMGYEVVSLSELIALGERPED